MTVQELYDQLSDEQLADALTDETFFKLIYERYCKILYSNLGLKWPITGLEKDCLILLHKQAATRWLKNQSK